MWVFTTSVFTTVLFGYWQFRQRASIKLKHIIQYDGRNYVFWLQRSVWLGCLDASAIECLWEFTVFRCLETIFPSHLLDTHLQLFESELPPVWTQSKMFTFLFAVLLLCWCVFWYCFFLFYTMCKYVRSQGAINVPTKWENPSNLFLFIRNILTHTHAHNLCNTIRYFRLFSLSSFQFLPHNRWQFSLFKHKRVQHDETKQFSRSQPITLHSTYKW